MEHEYVCHGALALLADLEVHTGRVFASTPKTTGIAPFMALIADVMARPEYKDAPRVFVVAATGRTTAARPPSVGCAKRTRTPS